MTEILSAHAEKLDAAVDGECPFTLLLDDPAGNSYVEGPAGSTLEQDPLLTLERYERSAAQQAAIGLLPRGEEPSHPSGQCAAWGFAGDCGG